LFLPQQIVYFNSFQFKNGNTPQTKNFIILANTADNVIIASLPTRTNTVPSFVTIDHGCTNIDDYKLELLETNYIEGIDYVIIDTLIKEEFGAVINCFKNSSSVKYKIKKRLQL